MGSWPGLPPYEFAGDCDCDRSCLRIVFGGAPSPGPGGPSFFFLGVFCSGATRLFFCILWLCSGATRLFFCIVWLRLSSCWAASFFWLFCPLHKTDLEMTMHSYTGRAGKLPLPCLRPQMTCLGKQSLDAPTLRHLYLQENSRTLPVPQPIELQTVTATAEPSVAVRPPLARGSLNTSGATSGQRSVDPFCENKLTCISPKTPLKRRHNKNKIC